MKCSRHIIVVMVITMRRRREEEHEEEQGRDKGTATETRAE